MPNPVSEIRSTGRRPSRSDNKLKTGPAKKLISPPATAKITFHSAAIAVSPPENCFKRLGRIGTMMPIDMALATALTNMKPNAARPPPSTGTGTGSNAARLSDIKRSTPRRGSGRVSSRQAQVQWRNASQVEQACSLGAVDQTGLGNMGERHESHSF